MYNNLSEVDPFSETPMEMPGEQEPGEGTRRRATNPGDDEVIVEESPKNNVEINTVSKAAYAEPLTPEEIQWFYKDGVDKRWNEFCGYDSLRIERIYRERQSLISESNDGTNGLPPAEKIVVRGGMYDVDIDNMKCVSIYWPGEEWEIMRGIWYYDGSWIPLETEHSKVIEEVHLKLFQKDSNNQSITTCDTNTPQSYKVLHTEQFPEFHVDWHSVNDVTLYSEYTPTKLMRSVTSKLGFAKTTGYRLKRGHKTRTSMEDKPRDIDHLVFVVHGIGQKRDTGKIIRNTTCFRDCVGWLRQKYFPNSKHRVEFFPVEWRSSLKLDGDIVDAITPYSVLSIRHLLNTSAMDILYYTSPLYGAEVRAGLQKELNRLYFMFASRHPGWQGKVSILAHSLGCVIVYDIVTGWIGPDTRLPCPQAQEVLLQGLQFPIENLFCLGSPLSVFLALRTRTPSNRLDVMPQSLCKRFYNIFHWSDPVAYRMEPLLERGYSKIEPVLIPPYGGVDDQQMPQSPSSLNNVDPPLPPTETDDKDDSPVDSPPNRNAEKGWSLWDLVRGGWNVREGPSSPTPDSNPPIRPGQELAQRLDYVLRAVGLGRNYLYTVTAHTAYWNNYDVAYFVLTRLFPTLET
ncbi:phospholipase DDHD1 isoform X2 [Temnothorax longispinosus]|uniref:phospholipase DDHD1 isoform X2 n=1 Tax=Temnothorax longispinosus TaxID=300112 RepID=UPI003A98DE57